MQSRDQSRPGASDRRLRRRARHGPRRSGRGIRAAGHRQCAALDRPRCGTHWLDLHEFWLTTKAAELGIKPDSGFAHRRGRRARPSRADAVLRPRPGAAARQHARATSSARSPSSCGTRCGTPTFGSTTACARVPQALQVARRTSRRRSACSRRGTSPATRSWRPARSAVSRRQWRTGIRVRFDELVEHARARWRRSGEIAHRAEPDLKSGRGGLRDVQLLNALAIAQLADAIPGRSLASPTETLARRTWRCSTCAPNCTGWPAAPASSCCAQDADEIGAALRIGDRFDLARTLSDAARTIGYSVDVGHADGAQRAAAARVRRGCAGRRCAGRSTRASSSTAARWCWPATPGPSGIPG